MWSTENSPFRNDTLASWHSWHHDNHLSFLSHAFHPGNGNSRDVKARSDLIIAEIDHERNASRLPFVLCVGASHIASENVILHPRNL